MRRAALVLAMLAAATAAASERADSCDDAEAARRLTVDRAYQAIDDTRSTADLVPAEALREAEAILAHMRQVIPMLIATNQNLKARLEQLEAEARQAADHE